MKKKLIALLVVLALVGGGALLLKNRQAQHGHGQPPALLPVVVETQRLSQGHTRLTLPAVADVQALRDGVVASRLTAYITALPLYEGQRFRKGDVLARLDVSQAEAEAQRAEATLAQTRVQEGTLAAADSALKAEQERVQRLQSLYKIQGVSLEQVQAAEAGLAAVRARQTGADAARQNLRYAVITAPFAGVVSQRLAQTGDLATPGKPLLKILDTGAGNRLLANVPADLHPAGLLLGGDLLPLTPWPEASSQGLRRYEARGGKDLAPGSRIDVRLLLFRSPEAIRLPADCLLNDDGKTATLLALKGKGAPATAPAAQGHAQPPKHGQHDKPAGGHHPPPSTWSAAARTSSPAWRPGHRSRFAPGGITDAASQYRPSFPRRRESSSCI